MIALDCMLGHTPKYPVNSCTEVSLNFQIAPQKVLDPELHQVTSINVLWNCFVLFSSSHVIPPNMAPYWFLNLEYNSRFQDFWISFLYHSLVLGPSQGEGPGEEATLSQMPNHQLWGILSNIIYTLLHHGTSLIGIGSFIPLKVDMHTAVLWIFTCPSSVCMV